MWYRIKERDYIERVALRTVEMIDQDDPGKTAQVAQALPEFFIDLNSSPHTDCTRGLDWHTGRFGKRGVDDPYRSEGNNRFSTWIHCRSPYTGYPEERETGLLTGVMSSHRSLLLK
jgi:hypothetical protein